MEAYKKKTIKLSIIDMAGTVGALGPCMAAIFLTNTSQCLYVPSEGAESVRIVDLDVTPTANEKDYLPKFMVGNLFLLSVSFTTLILAAVKICVVKSEKWLILPALKCLKSIKDLAMLASGITGAVLTMSSVGAECRGESFTGSFLFGFSIVILSIYGSICIIIPVLLCVKGGEYVNSFNEAPPPVKKEVDVFE